MNLKRARIQVLAGATAVCWAVLLPSTSALAARLTTISGSLSGASGKTQVLFKRHGSARAPRPNVDESTLAAALKQCKSERAHIGSKAFRNKYGTNRNKSNALAKCVSRTVSNHPGPTLPPDHPQPPDQPPPPYLPPPPDQPPPPAPDLTDCSLTARPIQAADYSHIEPLGHLSPSAHVFPTDHIYFYAAPGVHNASLYSPGDMILENIASRSATNGSNSWPTEYKLGFQCHRVSIYFDHVGSLTAEIQEAMQNASSQQCSDYSTGGAVYHSCNYSVSVPLQAGQAFGTTGDGLAIDLGAYDPSFPLPFINPSRYGPSHLDAVCPLDLFTPDLHAELQSSLGLAGVPRTAPPICGEVMQDRAGTAQGNWFLPGSSGPLSSGPLEDQGLALVHDNQDPSRPVFSVGTSVPNLSSSGYAYTPASSGLVDRDFADITSDGQTYCFDGLLKGIGSWMPVTDTVILTLPDAYTLRIERKSDTSCGSGPWTFGAGAVEFVR
jgi:hypothetical protein